ncbi:Rrp15p-domain-containing protein [Lasiosphaeris hirsuta]|uniref:Rrp15p-domain-containing protein n=1 Tax=Lasiosphaeris hirsuta TaxID=260670 RepID=A0AA40E075_9PEZI|nr:Rrp15p-domain-containing protein [Lasiosphaeris hirsuta]
MAGPTIRKRPLVADGPKSKVRPTKKQRKAAAYHSSSSEAEDSDNNEVTPLPANLLDSDDSDLENMEVDDGASSHSDLDSASGSESELENKPAQKPKTKSTQDPEFIAKDAPNSSADDLSDDGDSFSDAGSHSGSDDEGRPRNRKSKSKRNDPDAFSVSMQKMLSSKLSASRRADPIVARSAESAAAARQLVDSALEAKARKRLREAKRLAMEKGRVRDVLIASTTKTLNMATGEVEEVVDEGAETTAEIMATERRLRKVAQRGVVKLFNAVRASQVKATEAERAVRKQGIVGVKRNEEKVTEMSRKGFLDLIASGGGGLKKGGLEEA